MAEDTKSLIARTITSNRIVHNDLALGKGTVAQRRGPNNTQEQQIEITWIFRSLEEVKRLPTDRYTRIKIHQEGACREYWFDESSDAAADDYQVIESLITTTVGRWVLVEPVRDTVLAILDELGLYPIGT